MRNDADSFENKGQINIGKMIEEELRRQERSVTWFSRKLHCDRRNVYDIFTINYIDTGLLYRISLILHIDFFAYFFNSLKELDNQLNAPPICAYPMAIEAFWGRIPLLPVSEKAGVNFVSHNSEKNVTHRDDDSSC